MFKNTYSKSNVGSFDTSKVSKVQLFTICLTVLTTCFSSSSYIANSNIFSSLATKGLLVYFDQSADSILIHSLSQKGSYLVLAGNPLNEPVARYGPFVANTDGEVKQAMLDYQSGKMGKL